MKSVVVIGGGIAGLSAAIYSRLGGSEVRILEQRSVLGGKAAEYSEGGYRFDPGPSIVILSEIYDAVFRDSGRKPENYLQFLKIDPVSKLFFEGQKPLALPSDFSRLLEVVKSLSKEDASKLEQLIEKIETVEQLIAPAIFERSFDSVVDFLNLGLLKISRAVDVRTPFKKWIDKQFKQPALKAFLYGLPSYAGQSYDDPSPGAVFIAYNLLRKGVVYPKGGISQIPQSLERLARELGVEIESGAHVTRVETNGYSRATATFEGGQQVHADAVIFAVDWGLAQKLLGRSSPSKKNGLSYLTYQFGYDGLIEGLSHHNLFVPTNYDTFYQDLYSRKVLSDRPVFYVNEPSALDSSCAPAGKSAVFVVITCPACPKGSEWQLVAKGLPKLVQRELSTHGLEVDFNLIQGSRTQTPEEFQLRDGNIDGSLFGVEMNQRSNFGMPPSIRDRSYKNVAYCGGTVQPGAGMPMAVVSGKLAARLVMK